MGRVVRALLDTQEFQLLWIRYYRQTLARGFNRSHRESGRKVNKVTAENKRVPSLYEWLGEAEVLKALMVKFYERVAADELLRLFVRRNAGGPSA